MHTTPNKDEILDPIEGEIDAEFEVTGSVEDPNTGDFDDEVSVGMAADLLGPASEDPLMDETEEEPEEEEAEEETTDGEEPSHEEVTPAGDDLPMPPAPAKTPAKATAGRSALTSTSRSIARSSQRRSIDRETAARIFLENRDADESAAAAVMRYATAAKNKNIVDGVISGVDTRNKEVFWCIYDGEVTVRIPYAESFVVQESDLLGSKRNSILERQRQMMSQAIGAKVPFIVESFVPDPEGGYICYASRTAALERLRNTRYFGDNAPRKVKVGNRVNAQIITLGLYAAWVNACGMDIRVPVNQLSHKFIEDVSRDFYVGQELTMQVTRLSEAPGQMPEVSLSARPVEVEKYRPNLKRIRRGGVPPRFGGVITSIRTDKRGNNGIPNVVINLFLEGVEVPAFARTAQLHLRDDLRTGDKVMFEAFGKTSSGYVYGSIIKMIRRG